MGYMNLLRRVWPVLLLFAFAGTLGAQVIEFESNGLTFLTLTKGGVTVMYAPLPTRMKEYAAFQVAVSNGSPIAWNIRPPDFEWQRSDGTSVAAVPARSIVTAMIERGNRNDVMHLVSTYEMGLYGITRINSTNGYEQRRQAAMAEFGSAKLKAAAAASAIVLIETKLAAGQSTDGAIFFHTQGKPLGPGRLVVRVAGEVFAFDGEITELPHGTLQKR
jgi:hypothetical protein